MCISLNKHQLSFPASAQSSRQGQSGGERHQGPYPGAQHLTEQNPQMENLSWSCKAPCRKKTPGRAALGKARSAGRGCRHGNICKNKSANALLPPPRAAHAHGQHGFWANIQYPAARDMPSGLRQPCPGKPCQCRASCLCGAFIWMQAWILTKVL